MPMNAHINLRKSLLLLLAILPASLTAGNKIYSPTVKTLQTVVNSDWLSPAVMRLGTDDVLFISFDELSHTYHRYIYKVEHCEADWSASEDIFESDWLEGFNGNPIEDYEHSINTTVPYTHYTLQIPNDLCRLKMSGNYRLSIFDEDEDENPILTAEFMVTEQTMNTALSITTNTDIDTNVSHQQVAVSLSYGGRLVTNPEEQVKLVVMQNAKTIQKDIAPNFINANGLDWQHNRNLIFDAGNEYHKFEVLDVSHSTMGLESIRWDGSHYQAFPFICEPRLNYLYDEDADGSFYIRNSDNRENDISSDYVWVNYRLQAPALPDGKIIIDGHWTTDDNPYSYMMEYDEAESLYTAKILQKQGYYSYRYLWLKDDGTTCLLPSEGNFYQTQNRYQALVYYRGTEERTWRLVAYRQLTMN